MNFITVEERPLNREQRRGNKTRNKQKGKLLVAGHGRGDKSFAGQGGRKQMSVGLPDKKP